MLGGSTGKFVDQNRAGDAAAAVGGNGFPERYVIGNDDDLDGNSFRAREFRRKAEIQTVARIVLDDEQRTGRAACGPDAGQNGIGARRGEDIPSNRRRQHAAANIAGMRRLMTAAAAGEDGDFTLGRFGKIGLDHDVIVGQQRLPG